MKISMFSTHEMKFIWYLLNFFLLFILYFLGDVHLINLLTMLQAESQYVKEDKGVFVTEYLDQST